MNKYLIGAAVLVVIAGFVLLNNKAGTKNVGTSPSPSSVATPSGSASPSESAQERTGEKMVNLTKAGFEPQTITIKVGTKVTWVNKSGETATINSDPHPTHTLWPFLNLGRFEDGASVSATFDKAGTYTYHNHLNPSQTGTVVVE